MSHATSDPSQLARSRRSDCSDRRAREKNSRRKKKKKGKHRILHLLIPNVEPMPYVFSVVSHPRLFMIAGVSLSNKPSDAFDF